EKHSKSPRVRVLRDGSTIGIQAEQRETPCARRAKALHRGQRLGEQRRGPLPPRPLAIALRALAQCPEGTPVAILRPRVGVPASIEIHEVAKPSRVGI